MPSRLTSGLVQTDPPPADLTPFEVAPGSTWYHATHAFSRLSGAHDRLDHDLSPDHRLAAVWKATAQLTAPVVESHDRRRALSVPLPAGTAEHHLQPTGCQRLCQRTTDLSAPMPADEHTRRSRRSGYSPGTSPYEWALRLTRPYRTDWSNPSLITRRSHNWESFGMRSRRDETAIAEPGRPVVEGIGPKRLLCTVDCAR